jgi:hypothetical protein
MESPPIVGEHVDEQDDDSGGHRRRGHDMEPGVGVGLELGSGKPYDDRHRDDEEVSRRVHSCTSEYGPASSTWKLKALQIVTKMSIGAQSAERQELSVAAQACQWTGLWPPTTKGDCCVHGAAAMVMGGWACPHLDTWQIRDRSTLSAAGAI